MTSDILIRNWLLLTDIFLLGHNFKILAISKSFIIRSAQIKNRINSKATIYYLYNNNTISLSLYFEMELITLLEQLGKTVSSSSAHLMDQTSRDTLSNGTDSLRNRLHHSEELRASSINQERERDGGGPLLVRITVTENNYTWLYDQRCTANNCCTVSINVWQKGNWRRSKCHIIICYYHASNSKQAKFVAACTYGTETRQKHVKGSQAFLPEMSEYIHGVVFKKSFMCQR